jgi:chorismate synthase
MLRFLTAGESHGQALVGILEGMPAGVAVDISFLNAELARRQKGYGRGGRMQIEKDTLRILSGVRHLKTLGSPIVFLIENRDWENWKEVMAVEDNPGSTAVADPRSAPRTAPRPGHADLAGAIKYGQKDIRNVLERASARETAARVGVGAFAKLFLREFSLDFASHVVEICGVSLPDGRHAFAEIQSKAPQSELHCINPATEEKMKAKIDEAIARKDTVGGVFEVIVTGVPIGLGSYVQWDRRLDAQLAAAVMSIPSVKGVEIGMGFAQAHRFGSEVHDQIFFDGKTQAASRKKGFYRRTNNAGGLEGGITNGEDLVLRAVCKPLSTLMQPLATVDIVTKEPKEAIVERSDVCVVPCYGVVAEAVVALVLANAFLEKFGGDSLVEIHDHFRTYNERKF